MAISKKTLIKLMMELNVNAIGRRYVFDVWKKNTPSRRPTGKFMCVLDTIASRKMGWTRNSEARSTELPLLLWCELKKEVLAYYTQVDPITVSYINKNGKRVTRTTTPDFLIITSHAIYFVECKKHDALEKSISEEPGKFTKSESGYRFPAAEAEATRMGLHYRITTDRDFTPEFTRNCTYLFHYIDELHTCPTDIVDAVKESIVNAGNRIRLRDLSNTFGQLNIIQLLYHQHIFIAFEDDLLCQPDQTWVYAESTFCEAIKLLVKNHNLIVATSISQISESAYVWWSCERLEVLMACPAENFGIKLRHPDRGLISLSTEEIENLLASQSLYIQLPNDGQNSASALLCSKKAWQIEEAQHRLSAISGQTSPLALSERTMYRLKERIRNSADPLLAVVSDKEKRGNRTPRLRESVINLMEKHFNDLLKPAAPSVYAVWCEFKIECEQQSLPPCSYPSFNNRFKKLGHKYITLKQQGFKAAYALGPQPRPIDPDWDLPYHGDTILEVAHEDHTPIEMTLISKLNGEVLEGTLYLTILYDGHSRIILAVYITFEKPSYRSTMMLLRECYRRYKRIPAFIITDHGPDFESHYFQSTLADIGSNVRRRPTSACRHGGIIERVFGKTETELVHTLDGNRKLQKLGRGLSGTHRPEKFAKLTPDELEARLKDYAYLRYPNQNSRGISSTPMERWNDSANKFDDLPGIKVLSDTSFYISTLPNAPGDGCCTLSRNQIEFRGATYILSAAIPGYNGKKCRPPVKYDPYRIDIIYACICDRWVTLGTNDELIRECRDKGVSLAHMEVYSRRYRDGKRRRKGRITADTIEQASNDAEQHHFSASRNALDSPFGEGQAHTPPPARRPFDIKISSLSALNSYIERGGEK